MKKTLLLVFMLIFAASAWAQTPPPNELLNETFDDPVPLVDQSLLLGLYPGSHDNQWNGQWYRDRYAPGAFESYNFNGENVLRIATGFAESAAERLSNGFSTTPGKCHAMSGQPSGSHDCGHNHYNTQGYLFNQDGLGAITFSGDLYIPADWETKHRRSDIWATLTNSSGAVTSYPIWAFSNSTGSSPVFRYWASSASAWQNPGVDIVYDAWTNFEVRLINETLQYYLNGELVGTLAAPGSVEIRDVKIKIFNFDDPNLESFAPGMYDPGNNYEAYWDNIITTQGPVNNVTQESYHATIQDAIDAADPGDVIEVAAGVYDERITIHETLAGLQLRGAQYGVDARNRIDMDESVISSDFPVVQEHAGVWIRAENVTIDGFTILHDDHFWKHIKPDKNNFTFSNNITSRQIYISADVSDITFINNWFKETERDGATWVHSIVSEKSITNLVVENNLFTDVSKGAGVHLSGATADYLNTRIVGNDFKEIYVQAITIHGNLFEDLTIEHNNVDGEWRLILFFQGQTQLDGASIKYNVVSNCNNGIEVRAMLSWENVEIKYNSFDVETFAINNLNDHFVIDATGNWFGTTVGSEIAAKISDDVTFDPWLADDDIENPTCSGSVSNVINGTQGTNDNTIQGAVNDAVLDDVIYIKGGTYEEDVTDTKGVNFSPGTSAGCVEIVGDFTVTPTTTFTMEIFGAVECAANDSYDQFDVSGTLTLSNSNLDIKLIGYEPPVGTEFTIFKYNELEGKFNNPELIKAGNTYFVLNYGDETNKKITLTTVAPTFRMEIKTSGGL